MVSGSLVNLSTHGAFVAAPLSGLLELSPGVCLSLSTGLEAASQSEVTFALDDGALVWTSAVRHAAAGAILEVRARVAWSSSGNQRPATERREGVGLEFVLTERARRRVAALISELHCRELVANDESWLSQTPESRGKPPRLSKGVVALVPGLHPLGESRLSHLAPASRRGQGARRRSTITFEQALAALSGGPSPSLDS